MPTSLINLFLVFSFVLLALKWYMTGHFGRVVGQLVFIIPLCVFVYLAVITVMLRRNLPGVHTPLKRIHLSVSGKLHFILLFLYVLIFSIALFRTMGFSEAYSTKLMAGRFVSLIIMAATGYFIFREYARKGSLDSAWKFVFIGIGIYVLLNMMGAVIGISNPFVISTDLTMKDMMITLWGRSLIFPFSANHHAFAVESGLLAVLAFALSVHTQRRRKFIYIIVGLLAIVAVLVAYTRTPIIAMIGTLVFGVAYRRVPLKILFSALAVIIVIPLVMTNVDVTSLLQYLSVDFSFLTRDSNIAELATFNNRTYIWSFILKEFHNIKLIHLIGYGAFGHVVSGLCYEYGWMWPNPELVLLHNTYLQYLIDFGYFGLLVFLAMTGNIIVVLSRPKLRGNLLEKRFHPALAVLVYLIFCGLFEVNIYYSQILTFYVFLLVNYQVLWHDCYRNSPEGLPGTADRTR